MSANRTQAMNLYLRAIILVSLSWVAPCARASEPVQTHTIPLFNGKDLSGWTPVGRAGMSSWKIGRASLDPANPRQLTAAEAGDELIGFGRGVNLRSDAEFGDCLLELEFMVPKGSNSGIKMMNIYEIQIFDSFGKTRLDQQDCGAIYSENAPTVNAAKAPGEWQTLAIEFHAPRFDESGRKTANAKFVKVNLNGRVVQDHVEIAHGTNVGRFAKEHPTGPIYLQGDHGPVAFRHLRITPFS